MVVFRERTSGHQRPRHLALGSLEPTLRCTAHPGPVILPAGLWGRCVSGSRWPPPELVTPDGSWGGVAGRNLEGPQRKSGVLVAVLPLPWSRSAWRGPGRGAARVSGRYGAGRPLRPRPLRWRASVSHSLGGKSVAEALWQSLLGVSLSCGPRRREEGSVSGFYLTGLRLGHLSGTHLFSRAVLVGGSFLEACVGDAFDEISLWDLFGEGVSASEPPHSALSVQEQHIFSPFQSLFP